MVNYIFKNALITIVVILILTGCNGNLKSVHMSKGMDIILSDYIDRHSNDSVIIMQFYSVEDRTIINIQHSPFYPIKELVDGCFIYKDKLVVCCLIDKCTLAGSLIDSTFVSDRTILRNYKSWEEVDLIYDGKSDSETYLVKSQDNIVEAAETDLKFRENVSDTIGIRNRSMNSILNQRLNNYHATIIAIRFASLKNSDYFMISETNAYKKESLSGCIKRNGRIITFYGVEKLHNMELIDMKIIQKGLPLLNNYKLLSNRLFDFESSEGDVFKILLNGEIERVSVEELSDQKYEMLYNALGL